MCLFSSDFITLSSVYSHGTGISSVRGEAEGFGASAIAKRDSKALERETVYRGPVHQSRGK